MEWTMVAHEWERFAGGIRAKWGELTDDDLKVVAGDRRSFAEKLRERYLYEEDDADKAIDAWLATLSPERPRQGVLDRERAESEGMGQARYAPRDTLLPTS